MLTCTRVARSSWKKNINISSLAFSLRSMLASELLSPPLNNHPAWTLKFLGFSISMLVAKDKFFRRSFQTNWLSPKPIVVSFICPNCLLKQVDPQNPQYLEVARVLIDTLCTMATVQDNPSFTLLLQRTYFPFRSIYFCNKVILFKFSTSALRSQFREFNFVYWHLERFKKKRMKEETLVKNFTKPLNVYHSNYKILWADYKNPLYP